MEELLLRYTPLAVGKVLGRCVKLCRTSNVALSEI